MNDSPDSIKNNKKIIAVVLIVLVGIISVTAFVTMSQSMNETDPMNNSTDEPTDSPVDNTTEDTPDDATEESNSDEGSDTDNTTDTTSEQDSKNDSAEDTASELITTQYIEGSTDELRDVVVSENSTDENPILEIQVGATTQSVTVVDGITDNSTVYSINQNRTRDRFEVKAPQSNGTYSGTYYLWLTNNSGQTSKFQMDINENNLV
jgi:uncharacterized protein YxeA